MLKKIFNRKYYKAIEEIETKIEIVRGREDYHKAELRMGLPYEQACDAVHMAKYYETRRMALEDALRGIKKAH